MSHAQLAHYLLWLFAHNVRDRGLLLAWYRSQLPAMPQGWYPPYIRAGIRDYPHAMNACLHLLQRHASDRVLQRWCP